MELLSEELVFFKCGGEWGETKENRRQKMGIALFTSRKDLGATTEERVTGLEAPTKLRERRVERTTMLRAEGAMAVDSNSYAAMRLTFGFTRFPDL